MTPACWRRRSTPAPAGRARSNSRSPARTQPPRPRGRATGDAPQLLDQAVTIYERLDATRDLARADAALRAVGVRRGRPRHPPSSTRPDRLAKAPPPASGPWFSWSPRDYQPRDRPAAVRLTQDRANPSHARVRQAPHDLRAQLAAEATRHAGNEPGTATGDTTHSSPHPRRQGRLPVGPVPRHRPRKECADLRACHRDPDRSQHQPAGRCLPGRAACHASAGQRPAGPRLKMLYEPTARLMHNNKSQARARRPGT